MEKNNKTKKSGKINYAFWLMIIIFSLGLIATIYTAILIGFGAFSKEAKWFGYTKEQLDQEYEIISKKIENFNKRDLQLQTHFHPHGGDNNFFLLVTDNKNNLINEEGEVSLYFGRPANFVYNKIIFEKTPEGSFLSETFNLEPEGTWIFQLKVEYSDAIALKEFYFSYNPDTGHFFENPEFDRNQVERFPDLEL